jgi:WD40 repeat protein
MKRFDRRCFCAGVGFTLARIFLPRGDSHAAIVAPLAPTKLSYESIGETGPLGTPVNAIAWSSDGQLLALTSRGGRVVQLWDAKSKKKIWELNKQVADDSSSLAFTLDGTHLIISSALVGAEYRNVALSLIEVETGRLARNIDRPSNLNVDSHKASWATSWALNSAGTRLAASFFSVSRIPFAVYDTSDWRIASVIDSPSSWPRDRRFAFDPISGALATNAPALLLGAPNPSGNRPIGRPPSIEVWDVDAAKLIKRLPPHGAIRAYVPKSHSVIIGGIVPLLSVPQQLSYISLLDSVSEMKNTIAQVAGQVRDVAVNYNGTVFSSVCWGDILTVWRMSEDKTVLMWSRELDLSRRAYIGGPAFHPKVDIMAFAINNQLCLSQV